MKMAIGTNHKQSQLCGQHISIFVFCLISSHYFIFALFIKQEPNQSSQVKVTRTNPNSLSRDTQKIQGILLANIMYFIIS